jgi:hypothetical protein
VYLLSLDPDGIANTRLGAPRRAHDNAERRILINKGVSYAQG